MKKQVALSALGPDRPGLVDEISSAISKTGLNIEKSRMAVIGQEFSFVALVSGPAQEIDTFHSSLDTQLGSLGLDWIVRPTGMADQRASLGATIPYVLTVAAIDAVGLVAGISQVLSDAGANIEDLETTSTPAAESGTLIFHLAGIVLVPATTAIEKLRTQLGTLADDLNIDLTFEPS